MQYDEEQIHFDELAEVLKRANARRSADLGRWLKEFIPGDVRKEWPGPHGQLNGLPVRSRLDQGAAHVLTMRRFPMKHLVSTAIAAVILLTAANTVLWSHSPSTESHPDAMVIGHCRNLHALTGAKASELLPY
jgi:hypothetical protein